MLGGVGASEGKCERCSITLCEWMVNLRAGRVFSLCSIVLNAVAILESLPFVSAKFLDSETHAIVNCSHNSFSLTLVVFAPVFSVRFLFLCFWSVSPNIVPLRTI